jgi:hypothetical protein
MGVMSEYFAVVRAARDLIETRGATVVQPSQPVAKPAKGRAACDSPRAIAARKAWERRREAEEAVTVNLPAELLSVWKHNRGLFTGSPAERLDAFLQWAHEHDDERLAIMQEEADAAVARLVREREASDRGAK